MSEKKPKITLQQFGFQESKYERPNQKWVCGRLAEGCPCHLGPNDKGDCIATFECSPNRKGDRWDCTRPASRGGKCEQGPSPDGTCCKAIPKCQPVRNIRAKRGAFVLWCVGLTVGLLAIMLFSKANMKFIQPGELSHVHGQIFKDADGAKTAQACAQCHSAAHVTNEQGRQSPSMPNTWAQAAFTSAGGGALSENGKCLACHQNHPAFADEAFSSHPHSVDPDLLAKSKQSKGATGSKDGKGKADAKAKSKPLRWMFASLGPDVPKTASGQLACATCHKEHRGEMHNLADISNQSCQACHEQKFSSFSSGHPEFTSFPYDRRTRIKFDHANHETTYFKGAGAAFNCAQCHRVDSASEHMNVRSFEQACSQCHGDSMRKFNHVKDGVPVFRLPGMDLETLNEFTQTDAKNPWLGPWPPRADYGMDMPRLTPFMKLLLRADDDVAKAMDALPEKFDLGDLTQATDEQKKLAIRIGWGVKELLFELSRNGQEAMRVRLAKVLGDELNNDRLAELTAQVPASLLTSAQELWFPDLLVNVPAYRKGDAIDGRPAVKPPPPPKPKDPPKPKLNDDDLFGDEPADDGLFDPDPPAKPVDDSLFDCEPGDATGDEDLFNDAQFGSVDKSGSAGDTGKAKAVDDGLFDDDPPTPKGDAKSSDGDLFNDDPKNDPKPDANKSGGEDLFNDNGTDNGNTKPDDKPKTKAADDDLFGGDDLFDDDGGTPPAIKDDPPKIKEKTITPLPIEQRVPGGGWYLDEKSFALRYAPMGHGNVFLRQWLSSTANATSAPNAKAVQDVFETLSAKSGATCLKCHSVDGTSDATRTVNWNAKTPVAGERGFVKFSHRPHLNIAEMRNCKKCHEIEAQNVMDRYKDIDPHKAFVGVSGGHAGFKPMTKQSCSTCHQPKLAGDSCTKCHNYHIGEAPRFWNLKSSPSPGVAIDPKNHKKADRYSQGE